MKTKTFFVLFLLTCLSIDSEAKGGRSGSSSRGGSSSSRSSSSSKSSHSSSSGGWFGSKSSSSSNSYNPSPSYSAPAHQPSSYNSPSSSSGYGWNTNKPAESGFSHTNNANKPIGWNVGNNAPPAYPGLANRPVGPGNGNGPPAYSPSYSNPPAYNPSYNNPSYRQQNTYNTQSSYPANGYNNFNNYKPNYGSSFGSTGLSSNTYISNNYYGGGSSYGRSGIGSSFLASALFSGGSRRRDQRRWDRERDRRWRSTTRATYFQNKAPGSQSILPAAAVVAAAAAFGLASLLPLNVPSNKPLMYCNCTDIAQAQIQFDNNIYSCVNNSVAISCPRSLENSTVIDECLNKTMDCDVKELSENLYCTNGTLISQASAVCNSTTISNSTTILNGTIVNETLTILNCYHGSLPEALASFIPTTTTEAPTTTQKSLSMVAHIHVFFMHMIGKSHILEKARATTTSSPIEESPRFILKENETLWVPEALTYPPDYETANITTLEPETATTLESETTEVTTQNSTNSPTSENYEKENTTSAINSTFV